MDDDKVIESDPYLSNGRKRKLPHDAIFACAYDLNIGVDTVVEGAFLRRTSTEDELWVAAGYSLESIMEIARNADSRQEARAPLGVLGIGRAFVARREGDELDACVDLMALQFFHCSGLYWPERFLAGGIVDEVTYYRIKVRAEQELDENIRKARETETRIIEVARQLGLCPRPTGIDSRFWWANCPGKSHPLDIKAEDNLFFCGYCRRKGSIEELRALVKERTNH